MRLSDGDSDAAIGLVKESMVLKKDSEYGTAISSAQLGLIEAERGNFRERSRPSATPRLRSASSESPTTRPSVSTTSETPTATWIRPRRLFKPSRRLRGSLVMTITSICV